MWVTVCVRRVYRILQWWSHSCDDISQGLGMMVTGTLPVFHRIKNPSDCAVSTLWFVSYWTIGRFLHTSFCVGRPGKVAQYLIHWFTSYLAKLTILVRKTNETTRFCVDFRKLNVISSKGAAARHFCDAKFVRNWICWRWKMMCWPFASCRQFPCSLKYIWNLLLSLLRSR